MNIGAKTNRARRDMRGLSARSAGAAALALTFAAAAGAQTPGSVQDYQLPPQTQSAPPVTGPVDAEAPSARPTTAPPRAPEASPTATPTPAAPTITLPSASPSPRRTEAAPARRRAEDQPSATASNAAPPTAPAIDASAAASSTIAPLPEAQPSAAPVETADDTARAETNWPAIGAGLAAALAVLGVFALLRRRRARQSDADTYEEEYAEVEVEGADHSDSQPSAPATLPTPSAFPQQKPVSAEPAAAEPAPRVDLPEPAFAVEDVARNSEPTAADPIAIRLEAQNLNCSLVYANLAYRLVLTNHSAAETGPLRVSGDIISAHASLSQRDQLSLDGAPALHDVASIAPGESATLSGQLRMAMAHITPIKQAGAPLFVPLARFQVTGDGDASQPTTRIFVVGQVAERPGGGLRPFRLDQMPGVVRELDQRLVDQTAAEATL